MKNGLKTSPETMHWLMNQIKRLVSLIYIIPIILATDTFTYITSKRNMFI